MHSRRSPIAFIVLFIFFSSACQSGIVGKESPVREPTVAKISTREAPGPTNVPVLPQTEIPSPIPTMVDYSETIKDFAGKWIGYSVISLDLSKDARQKPGTRLEIAAGRFVVDGKACDAPIYQSKTITLKEYLAGYREPEMSFELNLDEFPLLQSGCTGMKPSSVALVNPRTLSARIGDDILYFELDLGISKNGLTINSDLVSESNKEPRYEVHAQVPQLDLPEAENFNKAARSIVDDELTGFKKNFIDWQIPTEMAAASSFMWIGYDVQLLTPELVSIRFLVDYYMAGAAHPNHYFRVLNYDMGTGKEILFSEFFKNPYEAIKVLSTASKISLSKPDFPLFEEGILPKKENFANWNLSQEGLRLSFDPYQVAPYAAGSQEILIPYRDIQDLVNLKSNAGKMIFKNYMRTAIP